MLVKQTKSKPNLVHFVSYHVEKRNVLDRSNIVVSSFRRAVEYC